MSVIITNISKKVRPTGLHQYRVTINGQRHIIDFMHKREEGIAMLFERAANAIRLQEYKNLEKIF